MRLKVSDVRLSDQFAKMAKACKAPLPWNVDDLGHVHDARGLVIMDLYLGGAQDALDCAHLIVLAVNTCGGFKAVSDTGGAGRPTAPKADVGGEA